MKISVVLPYNESGKYYTGWAHGEKNVDFKNDPLAAEMCTLSFAAEEICTHLTKAGLEARVTSEPADVNIILKTRGAKGEAFDINASGNDIILTGDGRIGTLYAAYEFLEAQGIRWYSPTQSYIPTIKKITLPSLRRYEYDFSSGRGFHFEQLSRESESLIIWMARNRLNLYICHANSKPLQDKLGFVYKIGGHIFEGILDPMNITENGRYYIDAHKDWYGKRDEEITAQNALYSQFCVSNSELMDFIGDVVINKLKNEWKNEHSFELAGFDTWGKTCQCPDCLKLGNGSDATLHFMSRIRARIDEAFARGEIDHNVTLSFDIYQGTSTLEAPENPVPQNLIDAGDFGMYSPILRCYAHDLYDTDCEMNAIYERTLREWSNTGLNLSINEYYNVSKFETMPLLFTKRMKNEIKYYASVAKEIQYMHLPLREWGVMTITQYLYANLTRDKNCDASALMEKYFDDIYGQYAQKAKEAYSLIEDATELCMSWRGWMTSILKNILLWDGTVPKVPFFKEYHLGDNAVPKGYDSVAKLKTALTMLREIKSDALLNVRPEMIGVGGGAVNPEQQKKTMQGLPFFDKINEDIRGVLYGADMYELLVLCLDYYNSLYEQREDAEQLFLKIKSLGDRMSEYTFGVDFAAYKPEIELRTALKHSQLVNLYYKIIANRNVK